MQTALHSHLKQADVNVNTDIRASRWRRVAPGVAGFLAIALLSHGTDQALRAAGVLPPLGAPMSAGLFALAAGYRTLFSVAGCALAARLAVDRPMRTAFALGAFGFVLSLLGVVANLSKPELGPLWYPIALVLVTPLCAWLGGKLGSKR